MAGVTSVLIRLSISATETILTSGVETPLEMGVAVVRDEALANNSLRTGGVFFSEASSIVAEWNSLLARLVVGKDEGCPPSDEDCPTSKLFE